MQKMLKYFWLPMKIIVTAKWRFSFRFYVCLKAKIAWKLNFLLSENSSKKTILDIWKFNFLNNVNE